MPDFENAFRKVFGASPPPGSPPSPIKIAGLMLKTGEKAYFASPAELVLRSPQEKEARKVEFKGGSDSVSGPIFGRVRYRRSWFWGRPVVRSKKYTLPELVDSGQLFLTNQRIAYLGQVKTLLIPLTRLIQLTLQGNGVIISREGSERPVILRFDRRAEFARLIEWLKRPEAPEK
jgi:hypothetical protein